MKKLNLNVANLGATEILSREELKKVLGGTGTGTDSGDTQCDTASATCEEGTDSDCSINERGECWSTKCSAICYDDV